MKRQCRPLKIRREVLISLAEHQLTEAAAGRASGKDPQPLSSGPSWCGHACYA